MKKKNWGIPINLPVLVKNGQLDVLVQKMHTGHKKNILCGHKS